MDERTQYKAALAYDYGADSFSHVQAFLDKQAFDISAVQIIIYILVDSSVFK